MEISSLFSCKALVTALDIAGNSSSERSITPPSTTLSQKFRKCFVSPETNPRKSAMVALFKSTLIGLLILRSLRTLELSPRLRGTTADDRQSRAIAWLLMDNAIARQRDPDYRIS